jgi:hypothetical protein
MNTMTSGTPPLHAASRQSAASKPSKKNTNDEPYGVDRDWSWTPGVLRPEHQRKAAGGDAELLPALALLSRLGVGRSGAVGRWWWMAVAVAAPICEEAVSGAIKENNLGEEEGAKGRP